MKKKYIILLTILVIPIFIISIELFSKGIILFYRTIVTSNTTKTIEKENKIGKTINTMTSEYIEEVNRDMSRMQTKFNSNYIWEAQPVQSKHLNIDKQGNRLNKQKVLKEEANHVIWFLGGLYSWGSFLSDEHTISSILQDRLNNNSQNKLFLVENRSGFSFQANQTLQKFKVDLLTEKPDAIIVMNGFDDYKNLWKFKTVNSLDLYAHTKLTKYWKMNANMDFFDNENFLYYLKFKVFKNTYSLWNMTKKWNSLRKFNKKGIDFWKTHHAQKRENYTQQVLNTSPSHLEFYLSNMNNIANMAIEKDIDVMFIQTPMVFGTNKNSDAIDIFHLTQNLFALSDEKLAQIKKIPTYQLETWSASQKKFFLDLKEFKKGYLRQENSLKELANKKGVIYHDIKPAINKENTKIFLNDFANTTVKGAKIYADSIYNKLLNTLYKNLD